MVELSIGDIARSAGAAYSGECAVISSVSSDTRNLPEGCLFIALKGERFDGHGFVAEALSRGAAFAVVSEDVDAPAEKLLMVRDTRQAYLDIAGLYRRGMPAKIIAVTGSVGKTTTKEMVACVCASKLNTLKTDMNLNNEIGVSQTLLRLKPAHGAAVLEIAMDGPGQIAPLAVAAAPEIAIVTNIGVMHLEAMGTRENIRDEKLSVTRGMPDGGALILNGDDDMLAGYKNSRLNLIFYGIDRRDCAVTASRVREFATHTTFEAAWDGLRYDAQIPCMGRHNVYNALAALSAGIALGIEPGDAIAALRNYRPAGMRQNIVVHNSFTVVEDCYNAGPESMRAAMETLGNIACGGKRIAVLSDMLELGKAAEDAHIEAGRQAAKSADMLLCIGAFSILYVQGAREAGMTNAAHYKNKDELFAAIRDIIAPQDVIWFKASRGMRLEEVIERIYKEL